MKNIFGFQKMKSAGKKITMVTCYDYSNALLLKDTDIDCLLVGDSVAMVMHGFDSTVHATIDMMAMHTAAVARANTGKLIVADLPFLSHRFDRQTMMKHVDQLMKAGASAIKVETLPGQEDCLAYISQSGVPVIGHVGLTPQYVHQFGGYKVQGRSDEQRQRIIEQCQRIEQVGCHAVVLECVPADLATTVTQNLNIATIGIGAGEQVDGQVLVLHDLLGLNTQFKPTFVRDFGSGEKWFRHSIESYIEQVQSSQFPSSSETFL